MSNDSIIKILRNGGGGLSSVSVIMPIWDKEEEDGSTVVNMPFLGLRFFAFDGMDIDELIHDTLKGFFTNCDKFGIGLEDELKTMGWIDNEDGTMIYPINEENFIVEQIVETGKEHPQEVLFQD